MKLNEFGHNCFAECHYAECHYTECHYTECHCTECHYTECHYTECHFTECHYAECHYTECPASTLTFIIPRPPHVFAMEMTDDAAIGQDDHDEREDVEEYHPEKKVKKFLKKIQKFI